MDTTADFRIRDPFILTDFKEGCYYLYGTMDFSGKSYDTYPRFSVRKSYDLKTFSEPRVIFDAAKNGYRGDREFWAPEVHVFGGKYYLFASTKAEGYCRRTDIFVCNTPDGDFKPVSDAPITPADWECLDGTLYVEDGTPYMVFCHEWLQVKNGEICAVQLSEDLSRPVGEPFLLFRAADNPSVTELSPGSGDYVTDGPFLYREGGELKMIWSSFRNGRYVVLGAESESIRSPWRHTESKFQIDGGHAMIFTTLSGERMITLHTPNTTGLERFAMYPF